MRLDSVNHMTALRVAVADDSVLLREGLVRVLVDAGLDVVGSFGDADALLAALQAPGATGLTVVAAREEVAEQAARRTLVVDVVGNDRPGIVRELSAAVASAGGNIVELTTGLESAPMSGHPMFRAHGVVSIPEDTETEVLIAAIECLGGDLTVDLSV